MMWRAPSLLWLCAPLLVLVVALLLAQRRRAAALADFAAPVLAARLAQGLSPRRRATRLGLRLAALALLVVALAGPKYGFRWEEVRREGIDLIVAVDTSRSMLATDVKPNRLERAKLAVLDLIPRLRGDRVGLVAFSGTAFLEAPLTLDYTAFARSLRALQVGIIPRGGTSLSRAIETSLEAFEARQGKYEALILITDGEDHEGEAAAAAEKAAQRGVRIFTVGIGTPEGELLPLADAAGFVKDRKGQVVKSRLNEEVLRDVALGSNGAYVRGLGPQLGLDQVFDDHIAKMERREVDSGLERRYEERFQIPLLAALLLLLIEAAVGDRAANGSRRRRVLQRLRRSAGAATGVACVVGIVIGSSGAARAGLLDGGGDPINDGVDQYAAGDYEAAMATFGQALVESPASPLLQFNLAAALHKQGRFDEAIAALEKVAAEGGDEWIARAGYNLGNAYYASGAAAEAEKPQEALEKWARALMAYRRAMGADPGGEDARFNHELVQRRMAALQQKLEQEQQEQDEQQEQQDQEQPDQEQPDEEQRDEEQQEEQPPDEQQQAGEDPPQQDEQGEEPPQDEQGEEPPQDGQGEEQEQQEPGEVPSAQEQEPPTADQQPPAEEDSGGEEGAEPQPAAPQDGSAAGAEAASDMESAEEQAAQAILDVARDEELGPEEIGRNTGVAGIGDPRQDW
jgi:Ca-activated chloride channel family protein